MTLRDTSQKITKNSDREAALVAIFFYHFTSDKSFAILPLASRVPILPPGTYPGDCQ